MKYVFIANPKLKHPVRPCLLPLTRGIFIPKVVEFPNFIWKTKRTEGYARWKRELHGYKISTDINVWVYDIRKK